MQDSRHFLQYSQNCENYKSSINNSKNNNEFYLKSDFTKIINTNKNCLDNTNKKANDNYLTNNNYLNNKNLAPLKNSYNNVSCKSNVICNSDLRYKNNATQNSNIGCNNSASSKRGLSCQSKACYKSTAYYENGINYKSYTTRCSATTKICLWLFLFVACLVVTIGFGCFGGNNNDSLKVDLATIDTAIAEGATATFSGGDGSASNPYQIANYTDLQALSNACNTSTSGTTYNHFKDEYFKLTADITIGTDWVPIATNLDGTTAKYFSGIFDGANHTINISNTISVVVSGSSGNYGYLGSLFGYVVTGEVKNVTMNFSLGENSLFSAPSSGYGYFGGIVGRCQNASISNCNVVGNSIVVIPESTNFVYNYFGGILGCGTSTSTSGTSANTIDNCSLSADVSLTKCLGAGIVYELVGNVSNCVVRSNFIVNSSSFILQEDYVGGIAGSATHVSNCKFLGGGFTNKRRNIIRSGIIVGEATTVENCVVASDGDDDANFDIICGDGGNTKAPRCGLIAGKATTISKCSVEATGVKLQVGADYGGLGGILAGEVGTMSNCVANVSVSTISFDDVSEFGFIVGEATGIVNNCISIVYATTVADAWREGAWIYSMGARGTFYNCVVVGCTNSLTSSNAGTDSNGTANSDGDEAFANTTDKMVMGTGGIYALSSNVTGANTNLTKLKTATTYTDTAAYGSSATTTFKWDATSTYKWDFKNTWAIKSTMNGGYPILQLAITSYNITLNVTTNLSGSTSSSTSGSTSGSSSTTATANPAQFIIYRFDESGNVVNQFVVRNGSTVTFEVDKNKAFTIMINYKLYMVTTIDAESTNKKTFTPTADTTINISITAPAGVNNWIVV